MTCRSFIYNATVPLFTSVLGRIIEEPEQRKLWGRIERHFIAGEEKASLC
jgi:hypothetical protein